jgi:hypothetical protein
MADPWGNLSEDEVAALRPGMRAMSDEEIAQRYAQRDGRVVFRSFRKSDRAAAGRLDIDDQDVVGGYEPFEVTLIAPEDFDYVPKLTAADRAAASSIDAAVAKLGAPWARGARADGDSGEGPGRPGHVRVPRVDGVAGGLPAHRR